MACGTDSMFDRIFRTAHSATGGGDRRGATGNSVDPDEPVRARFPRMAGIQGSYDDLFVAVPTTLAALLDAGDTGGSVAVFVDGEPIVDVWGGFADAERSIPWQRDTIANVWSVTKTMTALCALILADRGELDPDAPVARYWPEFATAGKDGVLVRHLLAHTAGLPDFEGTTSAGDLYDWPAVTARLAAQAPHGTGYRSRLPLAHPGIPRRRSYPADHRLQSWPVLRCRGGRPAGRGLPPGPGSRA